MNELIVKLIEFYDGFVSLLPFYKAYWHIILASIIVYSALCFYLDRKFGYGKKFMED